MATLRHKCSRRTFCAELNGNLIANWKVFNIKVGIFLLEIIDSFQRDHVAIKRRVVCPTIMSSPAMIQ
jgi:hypothetical protein